MKLLLFCRLTAYFKVKISKVHDFEADFLFQILSSTDKKSFFDLFLYVFKSIDHLNMKLLPILKLKFWKFRILEIVNSHPCE